MRTHNRMRLTLGRVATAAFSVASVTLVLAQPPQPPAPAPAPTTTAPTTTVPPNAHQLLPFLSASQGMGTPTSAPISH